VLHLEKIIKTCPRQVWYWDSPIYQRA